eukprot:15341268-Ditylum_brightwellii.AAC.1
MNLMYSPFEEELTELLLRFFSDLSSKEVLMKGCGFDSLEKGSLSGMCMEKKCLPHLQRALRVNRHNENDSIQ